MAGRSLAIRIYVIAPGLRPPGRKARDAPIAPLGRSETLVRAADREGRNSCNGIPQDEGRGMKDKDKAVRERSGESVPKRCVVVARARGRCGSLACHAQAFRTQRVATTPLAPRRGFGAQRRRAEKRLWSSDLRCLFITTYDDRFRPGEASSCGHVSLGNSQFRRRKSFARMALEVIEFSLCVGPAQNVVICT